MNQSEKAKIFESTNLSIIKTLLNGFTELFITEFSNTNYKIRINSEIELLINKYANKINDYNNFLQKESLINEFLINLYLLFAKDILNNYDSKRSLQYLKEKTIKLTELIETIREFTDSKNSLYWINLKTTELLNSELEFTFTFYFKKFANYILRNLHFKEYIINFAEFHFIKEYEYLSISNIDKILQMKFTLSIFDDKKINRVIGFLLAISENHNTKTNYLEKVIIKATKFSKFEDFLIFLRLYYKLQNIDTLAIYHNKNHYSKLLRKNSFVELGKEYYDLYILSKQFLKILLYELENINFNDNLSKTDDNFKGIYIDKHSKYYKELELI